MGGTRIWRYPTDDDAIMDILKEGTKLTQDLVADLDFSELDLSTLKVKRQVAKPGMVHSWTSEMDASGARNGPINLWTLPVSSSPSYTGWTRR